MCVCESYLESLIYIYIYICIDIVYAILAYILISLPTTFEHTSQECVRGWCGLFPRISFRHCLALITWDYLYVRDGEGGGSWGLATGAYMEHKDISFRCCVENASLKCYTDKSSAKQCFPLPPPPNAPNPQPISICPHRRLLFDRAGELGLIPGPCMWHRREQEEDTQQRVEFGQCRRKKGRRGGGWLMTTIQKFACNSPCIWFSQCCAQSLYAFISSNTYCSSVVCRSLSPSLCCICTTH